jgi:uncharacterized protein YbaP (TraB family)
MAISKPLVHRALFLLTILASVTAFAQQKDKQADCKPDAQNSLLWRIAGNGLQQPSYLYGTMHSKQRMVFDFGPEVLQALDACEVVAGELKMDLATLTQAKDLLFLPDGKTLRDYLTPAQYDSVATVLQTVLGKDQSLSTYERFMPFYLATLMQGSHLMEGEMPYFLDQYLQEYGASKGKALLGLETVQEQSAAFGAAGPEEQVVQLMGFVRKHKPGQPESTEWQVMLKHYRNQDLKALGALLDLAAQSEQEMGLNATQLDALVTRRNRVMATRIDSLAKLKPTFVAVGAAHLPGETGVIALLRAQGYTIEPVAFAFDGKGYVDLAKTKGASWVAYTSDAGGYRTRFPAKPIVMDREEAGRKLSVVMHADMGGTSYVVNHMPMDEQMAAKLKQADASEEMQRLMTDRLAKNGMKGEVLAQSTFEAYGTQGRQVRVKVSGLMDQIMDIRMFAKGDMLYTLMVMQPTASHQKAASDSFFAAFDWK